MIKALSLQSMTILLSYSNPRLHASLFTKQHELEIAVGGDALKLMSL